MKEKKKNIKKLKNKTYLYLLKEHQENMKHFKAIMKETLTPNSTRLNK